MAPSPRSPTRLTIGRRTRRSCELGWDWSTLLTFRAAPKAVCGATRTAGPLDFDCRAGLFAEYGRVQDAGSNTDFQSLVDDNYAGIGGELTLRFSLPGVKPLAPLSFSIGYRYVRILSGDLENPGRLSMDLTYAIPDSSFSIGLSQTRGRTSKRSKRKT